MLKYTTISFVVVRPRVPHNLTVFSADFYHPGWMYPGIGDTRAVYDRWVYPKLGPNTSV